MQQHSNLDVCIPGSQQPDLLVIRASTLLTKPWLSSAISWHNWLKCWGKKDPNKIDFHAQSCLILEINAELQAIIKTKNHTHTHLNSKHLFLTVLDLGKSKVKVRQIWCLVRAHTISHLRAMSHMMEVFLLSTLKK